MPKLGLRFYKKYLFGIVAIGGLFLLSATYFAHFALLNLHNNLPHQPGEGTADIRQKNVVIIRDLANRRRQQKQQNDDGISNKSTFRLTMRPTAAAPTAAVEQPQNATTFARAFAAAAEEPPQQQQHPPKKEEHSDKKNNEYRRNFVKKMMKFAWDGYARYAWGNNELKPNSKTAHFGSPFGGAKLGASIVDSLDTLYIMGLQEEFTKAKEWVEQKFDMRQSGGTLSVFETNIRFVGGLLSAYALTKEQIFRQKAQEVADLLLPAFDTPTGIPMPSVNVGTGHTGMYGWSGGCSVLAEFGSIELEFDYLSRITGNATYAQRARRIRDVVTGLDRADGLFPNYLNPQTGKWCQRHVSIGAMGDSFYEYLLKTWILNGRRDEHHWKTYIQAVEALEAKLLFKSSPSKLWYFAEMNGGWVEHKMGHLACFAVGMFALQSTHEKDAKRRAHYVELAEQIGNTCHEAYKRTATGIGPEAFRFNAEIEARSVSDSEAYYILRPEVVEGFFYLWRITGKQKYRDWSWEAVEAIEKHCRAEVGYSGIRNVNAQQAEQDDVQQSFFLAETLKYLYLTFADPSVSPSGQWEPSVLPLDKWVFNTEAHPFPIDISGATTIP